MLVALAPLLVGLMRQVRARLEGRAGAGIGQPWRDLRKLLAQGAVQRRRDQRRVGAAPVVLLGVEPAGRAP